MEVERRAETKQSPPAAGKERPSECSRADPSPEPEGSLERKQPEGHGDQHCRGGVDEWIVELAGVKTACKRSIGIESIEKRPPCRPDLVPVRLRHWRLVACVNDGSGE